MHAIRSQTQQMLEKSANDVEVAMRNIEGVQSHFHSISNVIYAGSVVMALVVVNVFGIVAMLLSPYRIHCTRVVLFAWILCVGVMSIDMVPERRLYLFLAGLMMAIVGETLYARSIQSRIPRPASSITLTASDHPMECMALSRHSPRLRVMPSLVSVRPRNWRRRLDGYKRSLSIHSDL